MTTANHTNKEENPKKDGPNWETKETKKQGKGM